MRFVERAAARIERDQERGIAPDDILPRLSAQALLAMVENHITREVVLSAATPPSRSARCRSSGGGPCTQARRRGSGLTAAPA